jgi:hypothetical protein
MGVGGQCYAPAALPGKEAPVPIIQEVGCASVPVWMGEEKIKILPPTGVRTPNCPACSE